MEAKRLSQTIAERMRFLIRSGDLAVGERLPPERELCDSFGVSRTALREALRILEANGLVQIKVGAAGGAIVTTPSFGTVGAGISDLLSMSALSAANVTEARRIIELGIVPVVCERATEEDVTELFALCDSAADRRAAGDYSISDSFGFHLRLAQATHNPAIAMLFQSFHEPILSSLSEADHTGVQGVDEHRKVVEAISQHDAEKALAAMSQHLDRTVARVGKPNGTQEDLT